MTISVYQLRTHLGASAKEIVQLQALFADYDGDDFPTAECTKALLLIRQRSKARDAITESYRAAQAAQAAQSASPVTRLVAKLRRAAHRRVPPQ